MDQWLQQLMENKKPWHPHLLAEMPNNKINQDTHICGRKPFANEIRGVKLLFCPCAIFIVHIPVDQTRIPSPDHSRAAVANPNIYTTLPWALELPHQLVELPISTKLHYLELQFFIGYPGTSAIFLMWFQRSVSRSNHWVGTFIEAVERPYQPSQNGV